MSTVSIRPFVESDRIEILALAPRLQDGVAKWRDPHAVRNAVEGWVTGSLDRADSDDHSVLVADRDGSVCGFVTVTTQPHWSGATDGYIGELVVSPHCEGEGIGTALIEAACDWSRSRGLGRILVQTGAANTRALDVYHSVGFEDEGVSLSRAP